MSRTRAHYMTRITRRHPRHRNRLVSVLLAFVGLGLLVQLVCVGAAVTVTGAAAMRYYHVVSTAGMAKLRTTAGPAASQPTRILDRHGKLLLEISDPNRGLQKSEPLDKIPRAMQEAIVASEDKTFWTNQGVSVSGVAQALRNDLRGGALTAGGSTITQQLVKRLVLNNSHTVTRKLQEMVIARAMSQPGSGYSKEKILDLYLNTVFFGQQAYGVEAAARVYFGKDIWRLDLAQCALLAGLVQAPSFYDPMANGPANALGRLRLHVLPLMVKLHYITQAQSKAAYAEAKTFTFDAPQWRLPETQSKAPYWTDWIKQLLQFGGSTDQSGYTNPTLANIVAKAGGLAAGLTITTTLDLDMYQHTQQIMQQQVAALQGQYNVQDAAVVTLDPKTAECLDMVGGIDYGPHGSYYNMAAEPRQPGSSFKVFNYLTAFRDKGYSPSTMILDEAKTWPDATEPGGVYAPTNYDQSWHGAVTVRMALANSYNMPAVKTIAVDGPENVAKTAYNMGIWAMAGVTHPGLSLTLGSHAVPLWQMAQGYNTIANGGVFRPMASVLAISDASGATIYRYHVPRGKQVMAPQYAYLITSILKDNDARVPAFGPNSVLQLGPDQTFSSNVPAAVKTGTTQNFKDNLTIGYTPNLLTATWVGNPDNTPMGNIEGIDGAGPIWHDTMEWSLQHLKLPIENFTMPPGIVLAKVSSSGYLASPQSAWTITDLFPVGAVPHTYDPGYGPDYNNYTAYHVLGQTFSIDGGTLDNAFQGDVSLSPQAVMNSVEQGPGSAGAAGGSPSGAPAPPSSGAAPGPPTTGLSGSSGVLPYDPGSHANICGGGSYTYVAIYGSNGAITGYSYRCG